MSRITSRLSTALADRYQIDRRLGEGDVPVDQAVNPRHSVVPRMSRSKADLAT